MNIRPEPTRGYVKTFCEQDTKSMRTPGKSVASAAPSTPSLGPYPVFYITAITHRKNAVYPVTIVGIPPAAFAGLLCGER